MLDAQQTTCMAEPGPYVEIVRGRRTYRFYGLGVWKVTGPGLAGWRPINGMDVPADVLLVAAAQCKSAPP